MVFWGSSDPPNPSSTTTRSSSSTGPSPDGWTVVDDEKVTDLKNCLNRLENELSGVQETLKKEESLTQAQKNEIAEFVREGVDFRKQIEALVKAGNAQTREIDGLRREIDVWKKQLDEEISKAKTLQTLIESSRKEVDSWRSRVEDEKAARSKDRVQHERALAAEQSSLTATVAQLKRDIQTEAEKREIEKRTSELEKSQLAVRERETKRTVKKLEEDLTEARRVMKEQERHVEDLNNQCMTCQLNHVKSTMKIADLEKKLEDKSKTDGFVEELRKRTEDVSRLEIQLLAKEAILAKKGAELDHNTHELIHLRTHEIPKLHDGLNSLGIENASLSDRADKAEKRTDNMKKDMDRVRKEKEEMELRLGHEIRVEDLQNQLDAERKKREELEAELDVLRKLQKLDVMT